MKAKDRKGASKVPLTFDIHVNRTVEKTGTSTVSIRTTGNKKSAFTVVLGCQANGQKLPPMVIFRRKTAKRKVAGQRHHQGEPTGLYGRG